MKHCPRCGRLLAETHVGTVRVDGCEGCGGVWLDVGELPALLRHSPEQLRQFEQERGQTTANMDAVKETHKVLACPVCSLPMERDTIHGSGIHVDTCAQCGGVWLDRGELSLAAEFSAQRRDRFGHTRREAERVRPLAKPTIMDAPQKMAHPWRDPTQEWKRWLGWGLVIFGVTWLLVVGGLSVAMMKQSERGCMDLIWALPAGFLILVGLKIVLPLTLTGGIEMLREGQIGSRTGGCLGAFAGFTVGVIVLFILGGGFGLLFGIYLIPLCILIGWAIGAALAHE